MEAQSVGGVEEAHRDAAVERSMPTSSMVSRMAAKGLFAVNLSTWGVDVYPRPLLSNQENLVPRPNKTGGWREFAAPKLSQSICIGVVW